MMPSWLGGAAALAGVVAGFFLGWLSCGGSRRRVGELQARLDALESAPQRWETRIERYELLWFPSLTAEPKRKVVTSAAAGLPHCRSCVEPLSLNKGEWACAKCGHRSPESIADMMITDQIGKEAVKQFLQRHPGYTTALGR